MIIVIKHEDMSDNHLCKFYDSIYDFAKTLDIKVSKKGIVSIKDYVFTFSYSMESYTEDEVIKDIVKTSTFLKYLKSRFYSIYDTTKII